MFRSFLFFVAALLFSAILYSGCSKPPGQYEFDLGVRELKQEQYVRAKTLFEKSIAKRPGSDENAMTYNYIGIACGKLGQYQDALEAFEDSRRLSPTLVEPIYNLGLLTEESGDTSHAIKLFEEASRMNAVDARPLESLGQIYIKRQQWSDARRSLYAALQRTPHSARIYTELALVELNADSAQKSVTMFMNALEENSKYAPALFDLGFIYQNYINDHEQAAAYFKKYLSVASGDDHATYAQAVVKQNLEQAKKPEQPAESQGATKRAPIESAQLPAKNSYDSFVRDATALATKGENQQALYLFLQAASDAARSNKKELQEQALQTAVKLCFDQPRAHYELGRFLLEKGNSDAALKSFKQATVLSRDYAPAYMGMGEAALRSGEFDAALIGYKEAVKADPKNPDALWALAILFDEKLGIPESAAKTYRQFQTNFPNDPRVVKARERAQKLSPATVPPVVTPSPVVIPAAPVASHPVVEPTTSVTRMTVVLKETPIVAKPIVATAQLPYKKPAFRNTKIAVQAFNRGATYQQQRDWDSAIYYYLRALENDDTLTSAFYNLGMVYNMKGEKDFAKTAYLQALEVEPRLVNARYNLALIYQEAGDSDAALQLLGDVIKAKPDYAQAYYVAGLVYSEKAKTHALAKQNFQKFLQLAPHDPSARFAQQWVNSH